MVKEDRYKQYIKHCEEQGLPIMPFYEFAIKELGYSGACPGGMFEFKVWCVGMEIPFLVRADDMFMEDNAYNFYVTDKRAGGLALSDSFPYCNVLRVSINHREDTND